MKLLLTLLLSGLILTGYCQSPQADSTATGPNDTTVIHIGNLKLIVIKDQMPDSITTKKEEKPDRGKLTYWAGFDVGVNGLLNPDYGTDLGDVNDALAVNYGRSRVISLNFMQYRARIIGDYVGITTGLGIQFNSYRLKNDYTLSFANDTIIGVKLDGRAYLKNKLRTTYLSVPVLLTFNTSKTPDRAFHLSAGIIGRLRIGDLYKQRYRFDGDTHREKLKSDLHTNPFQLDATVRVGYGWLTLFGTVGMLPYFEDGKAPEMYTFTTGIALRID